MEIPIIVAFRDRRYMKILIDNIKVINPRNREEEQFQMNVQSIDNNGMLMPIRVKLAFTTREAMKGRIGG